MTSKKYNRSAHLYLIGLALALFSACQSGAERDRQMLGKDLAATADLRKINHDLLTQKLITPDNFEKLKALRLKYPDSEDIEQTYKAALADREDWETLESLLKAKSADERKLEDHILLAQILMKRGKYEEGLDLLSELGPSTSLDIERRSIASYAYFNMGNLVEAAANLDSIWETLIVQKRVDDINLRGMIYFRNKEYEKAISTFERSLSIDPENPSSNNQLSRVYSAMGNAAQAEKYRQLSSTGHAARSQADASKMLFVSMGKKISAAWESKRYEEVIDLAQRMLPISDAKNKPALFRYLVEAHRALGNKAASDAAAAELQKLK